MPYKDPEKQRLYQRNYHKEWRKKNPEKVKGYQKKYKENNKELIKERRKQYYLKHRLELIEKTKLWIKNNPEKRRVTLERFYERNPDYSYTKWLEYKDTEKYKEQRRRGRRKHGNGKRPPLYFRNRDKLIFKLHNPCNRCGENDESVLEAHHIVSIKKGRALGWTDEEIHDIRNLKILCFTCHRGRGSLTHTE